MSFSMNIAADGSIFNQSTNRIQAVDADLRAKHTGEPAGDIKAQVILALRKIGVSMPDAELVAYSDAISRGEKFQFHLS